MRKVWYIDLLYSIIKYTETCWIIYRKIKLAEIAKIHAGRVMFGSSHGEFAFGPDNIENIFNLCSESQDIESSFALYNHTIEIDVNIQEIFLWFSIFSSGFDMNDTREKARKKAIFDIIKINILCRKNTIYQIVSKYIVYLNNKYKNGYIRTTDKQIFDDKSTARRASSHIIMLQKNNQWLHIRKFINIAKLHNHRLTIILSPARSDYKNFCKKVSFDKKYVLENIPDNLWEDFKILDLFNISSIKDDEFSDGDHLKNANRTADIFDGAFR